MSPAAPSVTHEDVIAAIEKETYTLLPNGRTTICQLTLYNDFTVEGSSACVSRENYDAVKGNKYAREKAIDKVWQMLGFRLADQLFTAKQPCSHTEVPSVAPLPAEPYPEGQLGRPVTLGEQVRFYERVGDQESVPMLALVTQIHSEISVSLAVFAPNGYHHARVGVDLLGPNDAYPLSVKHYARRQW